MGSVKLTATFDGACSMKHGTAAGAAIVFDEHGEILGQRAKFLRNVTTPVAEYTALHLALQLSREIVSFDLASTTLVVMGDAELVVRQVDGRYKAKKDDLRAMRDMAHLLMLGFEHAEVREFPKAGQYNKRRFGNAAADALASRCKTEERDLWE